MNGLEALHVAVRRLVPPVVCTLLALSTHVATARRDAGASAAPSFSRDVQPIFDANCVVCHQSGAASGGLNLESGTAYASLVSRKSEQSGLAYVAPGDPNASYLLRKLEGTHVEAGGSGERMPLSASLDAEALAVIRAWVEAGAKDD